MIDPQRERLSPSCSLIDDQRLDVLRQLVRSTSGGSMAEFGVYLGGSAKVIALADPTRPLLLFDTFQGMPEDDQHPKGWHVKGDFAADLNEVKIFLGQCTNVRFYPGWFPASADEVTDRFSFVHVDCDIYQSVKAAIAFFWPRMLPGGVIVFDDYGWHHTPGVDQAIHETFSQVNKSPNLNQCYVTKSDLAT